MLQPMIVYHVHSFVWGKVESLLTLPHVSRSLHTTVSHLCMYPGPYSSPDFVYQARPSLTLEKNRIHSSQLV